MTALLLLAFGASLVLCGLYLRVARRWQIVAMPDPRSSHSRPTPHGGGVPMLAAFLLALWLAAGWYRPWPPDFALLALLALLLMLPGILDDLWTLPVALRLAVYGACCLAAALYLLPADPAWPRWLLALPIALGMLWLVNLYNFMDGIDGIAAIQCALACAAAALLSWREGGGQYALFCMLLAACQLGFLVWNWPPARLFMGDAGSVPTGFLLAGLALLGAVGGELSPAAWLILLAVFITDASWTLLWRMFTRQPFTRPHRLHAYQRLSLRWGSHLKVDLVLAAIFCGWLLPLAWFAEIHPKYAFLLVILAYLPLLLGMAKTRPLA